MPPDHLTAERLRATALAETELAHLAGCVRCRGERRVAQRAPIEPADPAPAPTYALGRLLGSGGMGVVYEARHATLGTRHAVKLLRVPDPMLRARMLREGRLQARVVHRNVVPVEDVIDLDGAPALVMPFVEGPTLADVLAARALPAPVALALFRAVASGVAEIHRARLVHRDVKPANVLLEVLPDEVVPRVTDFGLAKALAATDATLQTGTGAVMGTPAYAAPEQLRDASRAGPRADVFALGAVLYELLTGRRAFAGLGRDPPPLDDVPAPLRALVAQCLAEDPGARPADAVALVDLLPHTDPIDLRPWCTAQAELAPPGLPRERDRLVGRDAELRHLDALLTAGARHVTVVGPPGVGKTRLLRRAAHRVGGRFAGAVWADGPGAADRVDRALADDPPSLLVVLDAPPPEVAGRISAWLAQRSGLVVLASMRTALGAEETLPLDGLPPADGAALFLARAAAGSGFRPAPDDLDRVVALVDRLGGNPLAIELCAAGLGARALDAFPASPAGSGAVDAVAMAVVRELSAAARSTFAQLSRLGDAFSVEAAEAAVDLSAHPDAPWVPDLVQELHDRALLSSAGGDDGVRLRVPAALREFAAAHMFEESIGARGIGSENA